MPNNRCLGVVTIPHFASLMVQPRKSCRDLLLQPRGSSFLSLDGILRRIWSGTPTTFLDKPPGILTSFSRRLEDVLLTLIRVPIPAYLLSNAITFCTCITCYTSSAVELQLKLPSFVNKGMYACCRHRAQKWPTCIRIRCPRCGA